MRRLLVLGFAVLFVTAAPAHARIGNPIKKAKEKLQKAVRPDAATPDAAGDNVTFDNVTLELTNERVEGVIAVFMKAKEAGAGRSELVQQREAKAAEGSKLEDKEGDAMRKLRNKRMDVEECYSEGYHKAAEAKAQEFAQRTASGDPKLLEKYAKIAQQNNAAVRAGDSTATARAQGGILEEYLPSSEDSAAVRKSCGPIPPKSPAEVRAEQIEKETAALDEKIRQIDERIAKAQAKDAKMTDQQWSVALERVQMYMAATKSSDGGGHSKKNKGEGNEQGGSGGSGNSGSGGSGSDSVKVRGYTRSEIEVLEKHRDQLRAAFE